MKTQVKIALALVVAFVVVIGTVIALTSGDDKPKPGGDGGTAAPAIPDSTAPAPDGVVGNVLGEPGSTDVVFTEFMDFECPACAGFTEVLADLQKEFAGKVTFEIRYLPLTDIHPNALPAAYAAESAGRQGYFGAMYKRIFAAQESWAGIDSDKAAAQFRTIAEDLGLDLATYDADVKSTEVKDRVERDRKAAVEMGATGTPSFFLDGKKLEPETYDDITAAIDAALKSA